MRIIRRQAIITSTFSAYDRRQIKASARSGSLVFYWDDDKDVAENHITAAKAFALKQGWKGRWFGGGLPDGRVVFVGTDSRHPIDTQTAFEIN